MPVIIDEVRTVDDELVAAFRRLVPQLSRSSSPPDLDVLREIVDHDACTLLVARDGGEIVGSLTLVIFPIPTGRRAWIEDVVVDEAASGRGVGTMLNEHALGLARDGGCSTVDLTSRPSREAANHLYAKLGFLRRETNVHRYDLRTS